MLNPLAAGMLSFFVDSQATILIAGSRGAGKTSLLTSLILEIPQNSRILVQEDTFEIPVEKIREYGFNIQRLKTRSPIGGTTYEVSPEDALRTALRLGDSAIIVGEIRSLEAKVLFEAMRVGAAGNTVMGTIHGDSAYSVWDRVVNDLEVPTTSFKAADFVIVAAPIRPKGALKRYRRLISITEVKKHWNKDPYEEGGFVDLMKYDANKDELELIEESIKESEFFIKISKLRGLSMEEIWNEIEMRGKMIEFITNAARKLNMPNT
jgi:type IV secretory pathway ATPase VirB11/archaellum biosynthesis ATPase